MKRSALKRGTSQLKRSGFKKPSLEAIKQRQAKSRTQVKKRSTGLPAWIKAIPESQSHGSGTLQKRLWRLVSDYVRIRDWYAHDGKCVATGIKIAHWTMGDAGHYKSYSTCNGLFKFNPINIHLQSKSSNGWGGQEIGYNFGEELKRRYGDATLKALEQYNRGSSLKFTTKEIHEKMKYLLEKMGRLPEQPQYYQRVLALLKEQL